MAYIPKYILKRLVPADSIKKIGNILQLKFVNVVTPISVSPEFPADLSGKIKVEIDGKPVPEKYIFNSELEIEGIKYKVNDLIKLKGQTIPLGSQIFIKIPDPDNLIQSGKTYKFKIWVYESNDISFEIERTVN